MEGHPEYAIDLDKIVASKFPGRKIPAPLMSFFKRLIHQDYINEFLTLGYEGVEFCNKAMEFLDVTVEVEGLERVKVPQGAKITFASNHPLGGIDGVSLAGVVGGHFGENLRILVNDFLMALKGLAPFCRGVNKTGSQSRNLPAVVQEIYESDNNVVIFPAGICSRKTSGVIQDLPWSKNFVKMSSRTGRYVVPVHFIGRNSNRFYNVANLCKLLKLKFNFAMIFLPDEMYRARHGKFKIIFGDPIPPETFDSSRSHYEWAQWVRKRAYKL